MLTYTNSAFGDIQLFHTILGALFGDRREKSVIDLCCHHAPHYRFLPFRKMVLVDVMDQQAHIDYGRFVQADAVNGEHEVFDEKYDWATCLDGIEHMPMSDGRRLVARMEHMASSQVLFTPLDPYCVEPESTDPTAHKCVWKPQDLEGYAALVFPRWHEVLSIGAFFSFKTPNLVEDFTRLISVIERHTNRDG